MSRLKIFRRIISSNDILGSMIYYYFPQDTVGIREFFCALDNLIPQ